MTRKFPFALFFSAALFVQMTACSQGAKKTNPEPKTDNFKTGQVIPHVNCIADSTLSYALYLPKNYDPSLRYPLIIAFDSHAAGKIPVDLFSAEADRNGYIIAGSNNSKNGLPVNVSLRIYEEIRRDILQRLSVEATRIYTAGFSGGSRVAAYIALNKVDICGVIGCSAGFPQIDKPPLRKFSYLGIVGNSDFNYTEMKTLDKSLADAGFVNHLLVFDGTHQWPPLSLIPSVFTWLELDAMRQKLKPADTIYINRIKSGYQKDIDSLHQRNDFVGEYLKCREALQYLNGVVDVSSFTAQAIQSGNTAQVKKKVEEDDRMARKETMLQQYYAASIGPQSLEWWKQEVKRMNNSEGQKNTNANAESIMFKRVLSYLSLASYMQASTALKAGDLVKAGYLLQVYSLVDPANAEAPYLKATMQAEQGKDMESMKSLNQAVDIGFTDLKRMGSDPAFSRFKGKPDFERIISRIRETK